MLVAINEGTMPPFGARITPDCAPPTAWLDDPRLSPQEQWLFQEWVDREYPLGPVDAIPDPPHPELADIQATLTPTRAWTISGMDDEFICYLLDPGNLEDEWVTGVQVRPGAASVVHHVIVAEIPPGPEQDQLVAQAGVGVPFDCGLSAPVHNLGVYVWTPGSQPLQTREGVAVPMPFGSKLVLQFHYHPHGITTDDLTSVDLTWSTVRPQRIYGVGLFGNESSAPNLLPGPDDRGAPEFRIPRNTPAHTEHMQIPITNTVPLATVGPHMHMLGTKLQARRIAGNDTQCLYTGDWNFDWQRYYTYDAPLDNLPELVQGDLLDITCTYDNTFWNPFMPRWLMDAGFPEPQDVLLGERSIDEMCLLIVGAVVDLPPARQAHDAVRSLATSLPSMTSRPLPW
jgi:hypothetical protein